MGKQYRARDKRKRRKRYVKRQKAKLRELQARKR